MGTQVSDNSLKLHYLVNHLIDLEFTLKSIAESSNFFLRNREKYDLEFLYDDSTGMIASVSLAPDRKGDSSPEDDLICDEDNNRTLGTIIWELREEHRQLCTHEIEPFAENIAGLHETWSKLWSALTELPQEILDPLSQLRGRNCRSFFRKHVLIPIRYWPDSPSRDWSYRGIRRMRRPVYPVAPSSLAGSRWSGQGESGKNCATVVGRGDIGRFGILEGRTDRTRGEVR